MIYHPNINQLFAGCMVMSLVTFDNVASYTQHHNSGITVYKGAIPTPAAIIADWSSYNSSSPDYLVHYNNGRWTLPGYQKMIQLGQIPTAQSPINSGTATWAILWAGLPADLSTATLPLASFLVVNVTDILGDGVLRFVSPVLTAGTPVAPQDATMAISIS
jgi:hypothetical protein